MGARRSEYSLETFGGNEDEDRGWNQLDTVGWEMAVPGLIERPSPNRGGDIAMNEAAKRSRSPVTSGTDP